MDAPIYLILFIGFALGYLFYEVFKIKAGGVLAIPLLIIYTISNVRLFFLTLFIAAIIFFILEMIFKKTAIYGRRLLYIGFGLSIILTSAAIVLLKAPKAVVFLTLIPGLIAYNFHKEKNSPAGLLWPLFLTDIYAIIMLLLAWLVL